MLTHTKKVFLLTAAVMALALAVTPFLIAGNVEQIVFSGNGSGTFDGKETPFGFWVWCAAESNNPNKGAYPGDNACQGAMYFYALGITEGVASFPTAIPGVVESPTGIYTMHVHSADGKVDCLLKNTSATPQKGPNNTVSVACTAPLGAASSFPTAVVNVTGP